MSAIRHFVDIDALDGEALRDILDEAKARKAARGDKGKAAVDESRPMCSRRGLLLRN